MSTDLLSAQVGGGAVGPRPAILEPMKPGLAQVRDKQFGVFTGWQVLCEYSRAEMREQIDRGVWVRVFRGVYREADSPPTARLRLEAARLFLGVPALVAAYGTAAQLHGFPVRADHVTHVLGAHPARYARLIVHADPIDARALETIQGAVVTGAARTAVDVARTASRAEGLAVIEAAMRAGVSHTALVVEWDAQRGRRGRGQADELIDAARAGAVCEPADGNGRPRAACASGAHRARRSSVSANGSR
ncbi:hypothetical protein [Nocardia farcinica]